MMIGVISQILHQHHHSRKLLILKSIIIFVVVLLLLLHTFKTKSQIGYQSAAHLWMKILKLSPSRATVFEFELRFFKTFFKFPQNVEHSHDNEKKYIEIIMSWRERLAKRKNNQSSEKNTTTKPMSWKDRLFVLLTKE